MRVEAKRQQTGGLWRMYVMGMGLFGGPSAVRGRPRQRWQSNPYRGEIKGLGRAVAVVALLVDRGGRAAGAAKSS